MRIRPPGLRLGTKFALVGALVLVGLWLVATEWWRRRAESSLEAQPSVSARELRAEVEARVDESLRKPPAAVREAVSEAMAAESLRLSDPRVRRLTAPPDLRRLVREALVRKEVDVAWIREPDGKLSWVVGGGPLAPGPPPLEGECVAVAPGKPRTWARCFELEVDAGPGDRFFAGALTPVSVAGGEREALVGRWALYLAGSPPELVERSPTWPKDLHLSHAFTDSRGPGDLRSAVVTASGRSLRVEAARLPGRPLVVAVIAPAGRGLTWLDLLRGDVGAEEGEARAWREWLLMSGGSVAAILLFLTLWAVRLNRAFDPLVAAAKALGRGERVHGVDRHRKDELGTLADVLVQAAKDVASARSAYEREARVAAWRDVARGIAHEIKNPLTPIRGTVENLLRWHREDKKRFEENFESRMTTVLDEVATLGRLAESFSEFARLPEPEKVPTDLNALVRNVADLHAQASPQVVVEARWDLELPPFPFDPKLVRQVVTNLVKNAIEAIGPEGGTLGVETGRKGRKAWFAVWDTGSAVSEATLASFFVPYFSTKGPAGTGLGLFLSHRICVEHGGSLEVARRPEGGLRFTAYLPME